MFQSTKVHVGHPGEHHQSHLGGVKHVMVKTSFSSVIYINYSFNKKRKLIKRVLFTIKHV